MKLSCAFGSVLALTLAIAAGGCAAAPEDGDAVAGDESELRAFKPTELAGSLANGEVRTIDHDGTPTYRVLSLDVDAGATVNLRVQAFGRDAVLWLLDEAGATLQRVDKTHDGEDEEIAYVAPRASRLRLAIREAKYRPASFIVSMNVLPAAASGIPACTGAPRLPSAGAVNLYDVVRIELAAACSDCGFVEVGRKAFPYSPIRIDANRYLTVDAALAADSLPGSGVTYDCQTTDTGSATLDASGKGRSSMHVSRTCTVHGGSGGPTEESGFRPGQATLGAGCFTLVDDDRGSSTHRFVYTAKYD